MGPMNSEIFRKRYGPAADFIMKQRNELGQRYILPWYRAFNNIRSRCISPGDSRWSSYGGRGIKCLVTRDDLREIFYRDKAWLFERPSVDRINPDGNYEYSNLRWIPWDSNLRIKYLQPKSRQKQLKEMCKIFDVYVKKNNWTPGVSRAMMRALNSQYIRRAKRAHGIK